MTDTPPPPLGDDARRVLDAVRDEPVDALRLERVKGRVAVAAGLTALVPSRSARAAASTSSAKLALVAAVSVAVLGVGAYVALRSPGSPSTTAPVSVAPTSPAPPPAAPLPESPASSTSAAESAPVDVAPVATVSVQPAANPQPPAKASTPPTAKTAAASAVPSTAEGVVVDTLAAERALLATAQQELSAKNYPKAREAYEKHLADYPQGALRAEASVGRVLALCGMRHPEARAEAAKLLATKPSSALGKRVRSACEVE